MSDGDWDLHAVVRSCTATRAVVDNVEEEERKQPFPDYYQNDNYAFQYSYPDQTECYGLEEIYGPIPNTNDFENEEVVHQPQLHKLQSSNCALPIPIPQSSTIGSQRRKNQHMKMVYQMRQEELSADIWAWRKYGQKPIKGSPYPRNYYRCSTLKGCAARKQVERSPTDSTIFIVSYTGEHTHPRPTHRSSLAGSSRNKFSATEALNNMIKSTTAGDSSPIAPNFSPSTSPSSALTFSPSSIYDDNNRDINTVDNTEIVDLDEDCQNEAIDGNDDNTLISNEEMFQELPVYDANNHFF